MQHPLDVVSHHSQGARLPSHQNKHSPRSKTFAQLAYRQCPIRSPISTRQLDNTVWRRLSQPAVSIQVSASPKRLRCRQIPNTRNFRAREEDRDAARFVQRAFTVGHCVCCARDTLSRPRMCRIPQETARNLTVLFELESHIGMALTTIWVLTFAKDESRHDSGGVFGEYRDLFLMPH